MIDTRALRGAIFEEYKNITDFCEAADVPRGTMDNVLNARNAPTWATVEKIMHALHRKSEEQKYRIFFADEVT